MEKILFKRPCIYKGKLFEQISVNYPNRYTNYYTIGGFIDGVYTFYLTDRFPRDTKKSIMDKLLKSSGREYINYYDIASALYSSGWKYTDKSEIIKEYDLTLFQANEICYWLREFEYRDNY